MQIGINLAVANFKNELIKLANESGLAPAIISVCLGEIKGSIDLQANQVIAKEEKEAREVVGNGEEICKTKLE